MSHTEGEVKKLVASGKKSNPFLEQDKKAAEEKERLRKIYEEKLKKGESAAATTVEANAALPTKPAQQEVKGTEVASSQGEKKNGDDAEQKKKCEEEQKTSQEAARVKQEQQEASEKASLEKQRKEAEEKASVEKKKKDEEEAKKKSDDEEAAKKKKEESEKQEQQLKKKQEEERLAQEKKKKDEEEVKKKSDEEATKKKKSEEEETKKKQQEEEETKKKQQEEEEKKSAQKSDEEEAKKKKEEDEKIERKRESDEKKKAALAELARKREELKKIQEKVTSSGAAASASATPTSPSPATAEAKTPSTTENTKEEAKPEKKKSAVREFMEARATQQKEANAAAPSQESSTSSAAASTADAKKSKSRSFFVPRSRGSASEPNSPAQDSSPASSGRNARSTVGMMPREAISKITANDPSIQIFDLSKNSIIQMKPLDYCLQISNALITNTNVTEVHLAGCQIPDQGAAKIAEAFKTNSTITELDLAQNKIGSDGLVAIANALAENKVIKTLNLLGQNSRFGEASLASVVRMFDTNTTLTNIIWRLDSKQAWAITKGISRNIEIERRIRDGLSTDDVDPIKRKEKGLGSTADFNSPNPVAEPVQSVPVVKEEAKKEAEKPKEVKKEAEKPKEENKKAVDESSVKLSNEDSREGKKALLVRTMSGGVSALKAEGQNDEAGAAGGEVKVVKAAAIPGFGSGGSKSTIVRKPRPKSESLSAPNSPGAPGNEPISPSSSSPAATSKQIMPREVIERLNKSDPDLKIVDLSKNSIMQMKSIEYLTHICKALESNSNVTELHLAACQISDQGAQKIAVMMKTNNTIIELDLAQNKIGSDGLIAIAIGLAGNKTCKTLNLLGQNSRFGEASLACVVKMFETNTTLTNIIWRLDSKQAWAITKCISRNKEMERRIRDGLSIDDIDPVKRREKEVTGVGVDNRDEK